MLFTLVENFIPYLFGILSFILLVYLLFIGAHSKKQNNRPPLLSGLPIVGYYPFLKGVSYIQLANLKSRYGGIFSFYLGFRFCVVLNDIDSLKEAFNQDACNGRPPNSSFRLSTNTAAFVEHSGKQWSEQRRFSLRVFRNLGFGKTRIEEVIKEEISILIEEYEKSEKMATSLENIMKLSTINIMNVLLFGRRFHFKDPDRTVIDKYLESISYVHTPVTLHFVFPWLRKLIFGLGLRIGGANYSLTKKLVRELVAFNDNEIRSHEETKTDEPRDYIDSYLEETKRYTKEENVFTKDNLNGNIQLFIRAGTMSTQSTIQWGVMACAAYPSVQRKIQTEIDKVIGREKPPSWSDHDMMPYTHAFLLEIQRWKTAVPINLLRYTICDTRIKGYDIPAGTTVIGNFWAAHNDPDYWEQPECMMPERFLNEDGTKVLKIDSFVSFSLGRRACPGMTLANEVMFIYLTTILQKFNAVPPPGEKINFDGISHLNYHPLFFRVVLQPR